MCEKSIIAKYWSRIFTCDFSIDQENAVRCLVGKVRNFAKSNGHSGLSRGNQNMADIERIGDMIYKI